MESRILCEQRTVMACEGLCEKAGQTGQEMACRDWCLSVVDTACSWWRRCWRWLRGTA
jgi:hypothetical protein